MESPGTLRKSLWRKHSCLPRSHSCERIRFLSHLPVPHSNCDQCDLHNGPPFAMLATALTRDNSNSVGGRSHLSTAPAVCTNEEACIKLVRNSKPLPNRLTPTRIA